MRQDDPLISDDCVQPDTRITNNSLVFRYLPASSDMEGYGRFKEKELINHNSPTQMKTSLSDRFALQHAERFRTCVPMMMSRLLHADRDALIRSDLSMQWMFLRDLHARMPCHDIQCSSMGAQLFSSVRVLSKPFQSRFFDAIE